MHFQKLLLPIIVCCAFSAYGSEMVLDTGLYKQTFCSNQIVIINNHIYSPLNPNGIEVIPGGAYDGTDSVFYVNLSFQLPVERYFSTMICEGDTIFINNRAYHTGHFMDTEIFENAASNGCDSIVYVNITFQAQPFSYLTDTLCEYESVIINGNTYDIDNNSGLEILKNASFIGCDSLVYISLYFRQSWVYLGEDRSLVEGDSVCVLVNSRFEPSDIQWTPNVSCLDPFCGSFCIDPITESLKYSVIFTDIYGCTSTDDIQINVSDNHLVYGGNVFSPGQGYPNDRFFLQADRGVVKINKLVVFDRWGEPVFEQTNMPNSYAGYDIGWDGTWKGRALPPDVYGWWAELENFQGRKFIRSGDITLLR